MIVSSNKVIWTASGVHPKEISAFLRESLEATGPIMLDVDILALYYKGRYAMSHLAAMKYVIRKMIYMADAGFNVTGILDGKYRPDCKRSSWKRILQSELAKTNSIFAQQRAQSVHAALEENPNREDAAELRKELESLSKEFRTNKNKVRSELPKNFKDELEDLVFRLFTLRPTYCEGNVNDDIIQAQFQADSMMAYRVHQKKAHVLFTTDTDMGVHLVSSDHFIIRSVDNVGKRKPGVEDLKCEISGYSPALMEKMKAKLTRDSIIWKEAKYPLFDFPSVKLKSYIAIALGCDVWKGIKNMGPAKIHKFLVSLPDGLSEKEREDTFIGYMIQQHKEQPHSSNRDDNTPAVFDKEVIQTLGSAFLDEAVIVEKDMLYTEDHMPDDSDDEQEYCYIHGKPETLAEYLEYFKHPSDSDIAVVKGPPTCKCNGIRGVSEPHLYLEAEGTCFCAQCKVAFCPSCGYDPSSLSAVMKKKSFYRDQNEPLCLFCYKVSSIGDVPDLDMEEANAMRAELESLNVKVPEYALPHEIDELHDRYLRDLPMYEAIVNETEFPLYPDSFLDTVNEKVIFKGDIFSPHGFLCANRGTFSDDTVLKIIELFTGFVAFKPETASPYATTVPSMIIEFANGSRPIPSTAHKVIRSCVRYATDPRFESIVEKNFRLFMHENDEGESVLGLILENKVPASMRAKHYSAVTAFTLQDLVSCKCDCLSSGMGVIDVTTGESNSKVACGHNLPLLYQVTLLFYSGYACNFLHDVAGRWTRELEEMTMESIELFQKVKKSLLTLMLAAKVKESVITESRSMISIADILDRYQVTTQRSSQDIPKAPKQHELIPFRNMPIESVFGNAKKRLRSRRANNAQTPRRTTNTGTTSIPVTPSPPRDKSVNATSIASVVPQAQTTTLPSNNSSTVASTQPQSPPTERRIVSSGSLLGGSLSSGALDVMHEEILLLAYALSPQEKTMILSPHESFEGLPRGVAMQSYEPLVAGQRRDFVYEYIPRMYWLNDEIINYYSTLLSSIDEEINPNGRSYIFNSQFMFWLLETNRGYDYEGVRTWSDRFPVRNIFTGLKRMIVPINIQNTHWSMLVVDFKNKIIRYYDSLGSDGSRYLQAMREYLRDYAHDNGFSFIAADWYLLSTGRHAPQQQNSYDCGLFIMVNTYLLIKNLPLEYTQHDIIRCNTRSIIALSIMNRTALAPVTIVRRTARGVGNKSQPHSQRQEEDDDEDDELPELESRHDSEENDAAVRENLHPNHQRSDVTRDEQEALFSLKDTVEKISKVSDESQLPHTDITFTPDWIRLSIMLAVIFGVRRIPSCFVGIACILKRDKEAQEKSTLSAANMAKLKKKVKSSLSTDINKSLRDLAGDRHQTNDLRKNSRSRRAKAATKSPGKTIPKKTGYSRLTVRKCAFPGCSSTTRDGCTFEKVPTAPKERDLNELYKKRPRDIS